MKTKTTHSEIRLDHWSQRPPKATPRVTKLMEEVRHEFTETDLAQLFDHVQFERRRRAALDRKEAKTWRIVAGDEVVVRGGDEGDLIGEHGVVVAATDYRCTVRLSQMNRSKTFYKSEVDVVMNPANEMPEPMAA